MPSVFLSVRVRLRFRFAQATPDTLRPDGPRLAAPRVARQGKAWWEEDVKSSNEIKQLRQSEGIYAPFEA